MEQVDRAWWLALFPGVALFLADPHTSIDVDDDGIKALADNVAIRAKQAGNPPLGVEGEQTAEWVLIDLGDVIVHVMLPDTREFYALEKLWSVGSSRDDG